MKIIIVVLCLLLIGAIAAFFGPLVAGITTLCLLAIVPHIVFASLKYLGKTNNTSTGRWGMSLISLTLVIILTIGWSVSAYHKEAKMKKLDAQRIAEVAAAKAIKEKETWKFSQVSESGEIQVFGVEVRKDEGDQLQLVIKREKTDRTNESIAGLTLTHKGEKLVGTWVSYLDEDHGNVELVKSVDNVWSGDYGLVDGTTRICTLSKEVSKP